MVTPNPNQIRTTQNQNQISNEPISENFCRYSHEYCCIDDRWWNISCEESLTTIQTGTCWSACSNEINGIHLTARSKDELLEKIKQSTKLDLILNKYLTSLVEGVKFGTEQEKVSNTITILSGVIKDLAHLFDSSVDENTFLDDENKLRIAIGKIQPYLNDIKEIIAETVKKLNKSFSASKDSHVMIMAALDKLKYNQEIKYEIVPKVNT